MPFIGGIKLASLNATDISKWMADMFRKGFTNNTRRRALRVCRLALNRAIKLKVIDSNPVNAVEMPPKDEEREIKPLEISECNSLFTACKNHRLGDAVVLSAMTGLRKGEIFALKWSAVNLAEGVLSVRETLVETKTFRGTKPPKSKASRRVVTLGDVAIEALKRRREKALGEGMDTSEIELVFPSTTGTWLWKSNFDRNVWHPIREAAGISDAFTFHDLRHNQASLMIAAGVSMKVVQERLGHSEFQITADTYSHLLQGAQADATEKVDRLFENIPERTAKVHF